MLKNMNKTLIIFGAVAIALLLVSSVTAVQNTQSISYNEQKEELDELTCKLEQLIDSPRMKKLNGMAEKNIDEEKRTELRENVRSKINELFHGSIGDIPDWVEEILALISAICCSIVEAFLLVLGHNPLGLGLGLITMSLVMIIPIFIFIVACYLTDLISSPLYVFEVMDEALDVDAIMHDYGMIGLFIVMGLFIVFWITYVAVATVVLLPLTTLVVLDRIIQDILDLYGFP